MGGTWPDRLLASVKGALFVDIVFTLLVFLFFAWAFSTPPSDSARQGVPFRYVVFVTSLYLCFRGFSRQRPLCVLAAWLLGSQPGFRTDLDLFYLPETLILLAFSCTSQIRFRPSHCPPWYPVIISGIGAIADLLLPFFDRNIPWSFVPLVLFALTGIKYWIARQDWPERAKWGGFLVSGLPLAFGVFVLGLLVDCLAQKMYDWFSSDRLFEPGLNRRDDFSTFLSDWYGAALTRNLFCCRLFVSFWEPNQPGLDLLMLSAVTHLALTWPMLYRLENGPLHQAQRRKMEYPLWMNVIVCAQIVQARPRVVLDVLWRVVLDVLWRVMPGFGAWLTA
jgi:hypothetical protein